MSMTFDVEYKEGDSTEHPSLNMSNSNAWRVLGALGIEQDYSGSIPAADLLGRILLAQGGVQSGRLDVGDPASRAIMAELSTGGACVIDCSGPIDEYLESRLPYLLAVAEAAIGAGREVQWC